MRRSVSAKGRQPHTASVSNSHKPSIDLPAGRRRKRALSPPLGSRTSVGAFQLGSRWRAKPLNSDCNEEMMRSNFDYKVIQSDFLGWVRTATAGKLGMLS